MRKCWNCGRPTNDENSRVCSDEICQRAEKKSSNGEFRNKALVRQHEKYREYYQRPEVKAKMREYAQRPEIKAKAREYQREYGQRPEVKAKRREYNQRPEVKERRREYQRKYTQRPEVKASEIRERMKKAMQDLGMTKELKLYFQEE